MKILALVAALILAGCSGSVPTPTNSPSMSNPQASPSPSPPLETVPAASTTPAPVADLPSWPPQPDRDFRYVPIDKLTLSKDGRHLSLDFVGSRAYAADDPCSAEYKASVTVVDGVLEVGVEESRRPAAAEGTLCDAMGYARNLQVDLEEPFTGSVWRDLNGYLHFLAPPDGLVELAGLPDGWLLRAQRDVEESPTGRWERTYSPDPSPDPARSVVLYQSFAGPVNVTGGDEAPDVVVNGQPATLYRWPPTGELVLVWRLGNDGLALVAYEQQFSVDELIALAESATVPAPSSGSGATWGPLAVVPPQDGADTARTEGTLRITDTCAFLVQPGGPSLLVWPADRTTWDGQTRTITFANFDGSTVSARDGMSVVLGGGGDSNDESGTTTEAWVSRTPWVAPPAASCPAESRWWVGALMR